MWGNLQFVHLFVRGVLSNFLVKLQQLIARAGGFEGEGGTRSEGCFLSLDAVSLNLLFQFKSIQATSFPP